MPRHLGCVVDPCLSSILAMSLVYFLGVLWLVAVTAAVQTSPKEDFYHAAVVEYCPFDGKDGEEILQKNGDELVKLIKEAAKTADIVVFPEIALHFTDLTVFLDIPYGENKKVPADDPDVHYVLRSLSQAARENKIYVASTLHEKDDSSGEVLKYNTGVVFDRNGAIVLKYRKFNLFNEPLNVTNVPDVSYFDSDLGVRFGMFICFDIVFEEPATQLLLNGVTDFIYPSWWFSIFPSTFSIQTQMAWAYVTDANLLSAGINSMERGSTGSGIYAGRKGPVVYLFNERNETRILTAKLFKKGKPGTSEGKILEPLNLGADSDLKLWPFACPSCDTHLLTSELQEDSLKKVNDVNNDSKYSLLSEKHIIETICQGTLCCEFSLNMTLIYKPLDQLDMSELSYVKNDSFYHYQYRLSAFNGEGSVNGSTAMGMQVCGVIPCTSSSLESCTQKSGNAPPLKIKTDSHGDLFLYSTTFNKILIRAVSEEKTDFSSPVILESSNSEGIKAFGSLPDASKIDFTVDRQSSQLQFSSDRLVYAGISSRIFSRDKTSPQILLDTKSHLHIEL